LPSGLATGFYAVDDTGSFTAAAGIGQTICPAGFYCSGGNKTACDESSGEYCSEGSPSAAACAVGHFCPTPKEQILCDPGTYCPQSSIRPQACVQDATCTIPASPELVLLPSSFDVRETEIFESNGVLQYNLSLSARPNEAVTVRMQKIVDNQTSVACAKYDDGFELDHAEFTFGPSNYNIPQTVVITANRIADLYEGSAVVSIEHTIISDDPTWKSAFSRPVSLALSDDTPCPEGAVKIDGGYYHNQEVTGMRVCGCNEGFYTVEEDPWICKSATACQSCPVGMQCNLEKWVFNGMQQIEDASIERGYYRSSNISDLVVPCPIPRNCEGTLDGTEYGNAGDALCRVGHMGVLCMVCVVNSTHVYARNGDGCSLCDRGADASIYGISIAFVLVVLAVIGNILRRRLPPSKKLPLKLATDVSGWEAFVDNATTKYKIIIKTIQIMSKFTLVYPFALPQSFLAFFSHINFLNLDLMDLPFLNCVIDANFHSLLVATTVFPFVFVACVFALYGIQRVRIQRSESGEPHKEIQHLQAKCVFTVTLFLISVLPIISATIFQTFVYDERMGNGSAYLSADYRIERSDSKHKAYVAYAIVMGLVYCIGIPLLALQTLHTRKKLIRKLQSAEARHLDTVALMKQDEPLLTGLSPLFKDYGPDYWWFEIPQWFVTVFLCGISSLLPGEDSTQVAVSVIVTIGMLITIANAHPYLQWSDDLVAQICQASLILVLFIGLLEMNETADQDDWLHGPLLIFATSATLLLAFVSFGIEYARAVAPMAFEKVASRMRFWNHPALVKTVRKRLSASVAVAPCSEVTSFIKDEDTATGASAH
jgi:hypothetical protein